MLNKKDGSGVAPGSLEGARSATGGEPDAAVEVKRRSAGRKKDQQDEDWNFHGVGLTSRAEVKETAH